MVKKDRGGVTFPEGFKAAGIHAGIKKKGALDLGLLVSEKEALIVGMFTVNKMKAAPVQISQRRVRRGIGMAIIVNSGNANACTGEQGMADAMLLTEKVGHYIGCSAQKVLPASTGVIGRNLPMPSILNALPALSEKISPKGYVDFSKAIMTTDTYPKSSQKEVLIGGKIVKIGGSAKGVGMIHPNMATMLVFITTDAVIEKDALRASLHQIVEEQFHTLSVDGDTSTNDSVYLMANQMAGNPVIGKGTEWHREFTQALMEVASELRNLLLRDAEGATKFLHLVIQGARSKSDAKKIASTIAKSLLVKTAFYGEDVNWGRIMAAIGNAGVPVRTEKILIAVGDVALVEHGVGLGVDQEEKALEVLKKSDITVTVHLGMGQMTAEYWTTDLSYEYVRINAGYKGRT
jgi:glutamate N-acetyltransferase/amino-acid N-acetyltransferase